MGEILRSRGGRLALAVVSLTLLVAGGVATWHLATAPPTVEAVAAEAARARGAAAAPAPAAPTALVDGLRLG